MKTISVSYMGKPWKKMYRNKYGQYTYSKFNQLIQTMKRIVKITLYTSFIAGAIVGAFRAGQTLPDVTYARTEPIIDHLPAKIEQLKAEVLDTLKNCESRTHTESDGLIVMDSNNELSIGLFQFQILTVQHYYKSIYQQEITRKEAVEIALNEQKSRQLANDIIFTAQGIRNWANCATKHELNQKVAFIKNLETK